MKCPKCGYEFRGSKDVCPACGAAIPPPAPQKREEKTSVFLKYSEFLSDEALYKAAVCKLNGIEVSKNEKDAFDMFLTLSFRGYPDAMYQLSDLLLKRDPPDTETALRWLRIAASEGHKPSRLKLEFLNAPPEEENPTPPSPAPEPPNVAPNLMNLIREALPNIVCIKAVSETETERFSMKGTGFIVEGGYVVTNAHVIGQDPISIVARFDPKIDDCIYSLRPLCASEETDIAVLRFSGLKNEQISKRKNLALRYGNVESGEDVYTIGNPLGIGLSVSKGIVSHPGRELNITKGHEVIQTDFTINHGNSGGPLLDYRNNVLGIATFSLKGSEGGMAMCVSSKDIAEILGILKAKKL